MNPSLPSTQGVQRTEWGMSSNPSILELTGIRSPLYPTLLIHLIDLWTKWTNDVSLLIKSSTQPECKLWIIDIGSPLLDQISTQIFVSSCAEVSHHIEINRFIIFIYNMIIISMGGRHSQTHQQY